MTLSYSSSFVVLAEAGTQARYAVLSLFLDPRLAQE
jgi:hypothetical protein